MKKNIMMRLSALLLVAVLLTTCVISGTFAKYVTTNSAEDSARVAKWGVTVTANSSTVATVTEIGGADEEHVLASSAAQVILAPGTKATELADFTITGEPEVAVNVSYVAVLTLEGWEVESAFYCPLEINVNGTVISGLDYTAASAFKTAVENAISGLSDNYGVGATLSGVLAPQVSVAWAFEGDNAKDTALGNQAANGNNSVVSLDITCTVTQID